MITPSEFKHTYRTRELQVALMDALSDAVVAVDNAGQIIFKNERFDEIFLEQKNNADLPCLFSETPTVMEAFTLGLRGESSSVKSFAHGNPQKGAVRYYSLSISPFRSESGHTEGAIGIFHDVTELKKSEQIRIDFVANVSHELRTPLTAIKGYADTVLHDLDQNLPVERSFVETIARNANRLMNLISDLLDLSLLDAEADHLEKCEVNTEEACRRVQRQLSGKVALKGQKLTFECRTPIVHADPARLDQVLINLCDNAHKYAPAGGHIHISWTPTDDGGALLAVQDNGPGIAAEHHGRLFERFYRIDKARSRDMGGTGLGLAIVKHIMQRHGGQVWIESVLGHGATLLCRFPPCFLANNTTSR
jgi:two-component system phosphate regulon sensor histidine kinase PhoR